ncbi:MAG: GTP-binding protein, partial [Clostridia bacterium]|nr:GTP-binding protein [Clostridia bacterium]
MKNYSTDKIRNVCILGNGNSGKTTVAESMLKFSETIERRGSVLDGTTISDYDPEEIKRKISINTSLLTFEFGSCKYNVLDTPGSYDFVGETLEAVRVADAAVIVISGKSGVSAGVEKAWELCNSRNLPRIVFVNKVDDERCNYRKVLSELRDSFGKTVAPFQLPISNGEKIIGFVDLVSMKGKLFQEGQLADTAIPEDMLTEVEPIRNMIIESVAETDEELMDRYFNGEEFTIDEIKKALRKGIDSGDIVPVICGTALHNKGVGVLLENIEAYFPSPKDVEDFDYNSDAKPSVFIFKTIADPFVGKLSFFKVMSGKIKGDTQLINISTKSLEKLGKIYSMLGKKQIEVSELCAGDI